jgi:hypothetical protein
VEEAAWVGSLKEELAEGRAKVDEMARRLQEVLEAKEEVSSVSICTFVPVKLCQYLYLCTSKARRLQEVLEGNEKVAAPFCVSVFLLLSQ